MKTPEKCLEAGLATMRERKAQHGGDHTFQMFGEVMHALFPAGLDATNAEQWTRLGVLQIMVHKLCRLSLDFGRGGSNTENPHDLGNYSFIFESLLHASGGCTLCNRPITSGLFTDEEGQLWHEQCFDNYARDLVR